mgnify:CR=1 FL=1|tara:strand:- start:202 stop:723 length:522 start_codon:yes stop_codon:yes gene_type:complete
MPEPINKYSLNGLIAYPFANLIASKICHKISANVITYINSALSLYIIHIVAMYPCNYYLIFFLALLRAFLDILDGAVARKCNDTSEFGSKLDKTTDIVYASLLYIIFTYHCIKNPSIYKAPYFKPVLLLCMVILCMGWSEGVNKTIGFWQDNDILLRPIVYSCFAYLVSSCAK